MSAFVVKQNTNRAGTVNMFGGIRSCILAICVVSTAALPARADNQAFSDLLARAQAEAAAGHRWAPPGDNMTETVMKMMDLISTATPNQIAELSALLDRERTAVEQPTANANASASKPADDVAALPDPLAGQQPPDYAKAEPATPAEPTGQERKQQDASREEPPGDVRPSQIGPGRVAPDDVGSSQTGMGDTGPGPAAPPSDVGSNDKVPGETGSRPATPSDIGSIQMGPGQAGSRPPAPGDRGSSQIGFAQPGPGRSASGQIGPADIGPGPVEPRPPVPAPGPRAALLFARGIDAERRGDISGARRFYFSSAEAGDAAAARNLGRLYDPTYLEQMALGGIDPDPALARHWYERAVKLGDNQAVPLLAALSER